MPVQLPADIQELLNKDFETRAEAKIKQILDRSDLTDEVKAEVLLQQSADKRRARSFPLLESFLQDWANGKQAQVEDRLALLKKILGVIDQSELHAVAERGNREQAETIQRAHDLIRNLNRWIPSLAGQDLQPVLMYLEWADEVSVNFSRVARQEIYQAVNTRAKDKVLNAEEAYVMELLDRKTTGYSLSQITELLPRISARRFLAFYKFYSGNKHRNGKKINGKTKEGRNLLQHYAQIKTMLQNHAASNPDLQGFIVLVDAYYDIKEHVREDSASGKGAQIVGGSSSSAKAEKAKAKQTMRVDLNQRLGAVFSAKNDFQLEQRLGDLTRFLYERSQGQYKKSWDQAREGVTSHRLRDTLDRLLSVFDAKKAIDKVNGLIKPSVAECERALVLAAAVLPRAEFEAFVAKHIGKKVFKEKLHTLTPSQLLVLVYRVADFSSYEIGVSFSGEISHSALSHGINLEKGQYADVLAVVFAFTEVAQKISLLVKEQEDLTHQLAGIPADVPDAFKRAKQDPLHRSLDSVSVKISKLSMLQAQLKEAMARARDSGTGIKVSVQVRQAADAVMDTLSDEAEQPIELGQLKKALTVFKRHFPIITGGAERSARTAVVDTAEAEINVFELGEYPLRHYLESLPQDQREACFQQVDPRTGYSLLAFILSKPERSKVVLPTAMAVLKSLNPKTVISLVLQQTGSKSAEIRPSENPDVINSLNRQHMLFLAVSGLSAGMKNGSTVWDSAEVQRLIKAVGEVADVYSKAKHDPADSQILGLLTAIDNVFKKPACQKDELLLQALQTLRQNFNLTDYAHSVWNPQAIKMALSACVSFYDLEHGQRVNVLKDLRQNMAVKSVAVDPELMRMADLAEVALDLQALSADYAKRVREHDDFKDRSERAALAHMKKIISTHRMSGHDEFMAEAGYAPEKKLEPVKQDFCQAVLNAVKAVLTQLSAAGISYEIKPEASLQVVLAILKKHEKWPKVIAGNSRLEHAFKKLGSILDGSVEGDQFQTALDSLILADLVKNRSYSTALLAFVVEKSPHSMSTVLDNERLTNHMLLLLNQKSEYYSSAFESLLNDRAKNLSVNVLINLLFLSWTKKHVSLQKIVSSSSLVEEIQFGSDGSKFKKRVVFFNALAVLTGLNKEYENKGKSEIGGKRIVCSQLLEKMGAIVSAMQGGVGDTEVDQLLADFGQYLSFLDQKTEMAAEAQVDGLTARLGAVVRQLQSEFKGFASERSFKESVEKMGSTLQDRDMNFALLQDAMSTQDGVKFMVAQKPKEVLMALQHAISHVPSAFRSKFPKVVEQCSDILNLAHENSYDLLHHAVSKNNKRAVSVILTAVLKLPSKVDQNNILQRAFEGKKAIDQPVVRTTLESWKRLGDEAAADVLERHDVFIQSDGAPRAARPTAVIKASNGGMFGSSTGGSSSGNSKDQDDPFTGPGAHDKDGFEL